MFWEIPTSRFHAKFIIKCQRGLQEKKSVWGPSSHETLMWSNRFFHSMETTTLAAVLIIQFLDSSKIIGFFNRPVMKIEHILGKKSFLSCLFFFLQVLLCFIANVIHCMSTHFFCWSVLTSASFGFLRHWRVYFVGLIMNWKCWFSEKVAYRHFCC